MCLNPMYAWRYENEKKLHFSPYPSEKGSKVIEFFTIPCGKCPECLTHYSYEWSLRIMLEAKYNPPAAFITLTYDDVHVPKDGQLHKEDFQKFMKRFRK